MTDDYPTFFLPRMVAAAAARLPVRLEAVDANGLLPLRAADKDYVTAAHFRRFLQKVLPDHLEHAPAEDPLDDPLPARLKSLPREIAKRWPAASPECWAEDRSPPCRSITRCRRSRPRGAGDSAGERALDRFLSERLERYGEGRNDPGEEVTSALSPYLHFGHVAPHQMFAAVAARERWSPERLAARPTGAREGWWGMGPAAEKFLDEAITWREVGYNMAAHREDFERLRVAPGRGPRPRWPSTRAIPGRTSTPRGQWDAGETHDELWNAAQGQLREEGRIHNYLRMLWGKKVLEWSAIAARGARDPGRSQQQVRPGRARSQLLQRHLLDLRPLRPPLGAGAADLRHGAVHELGQHAAEIQGGRVHCALRRKEHGSDVVATKKTDAIHHPGAPGAHAASPLLLRLGRPEGRAVPARPAAGAVPPSAGRIDRRGLSQPGQRRRLRPQRGPSSSTPPAR